MWLWLLSQAARRAPRLAAATWARLPNQVQKALRPYVHPVALGERSPGLMLTVDAAAPVRSVDVVIASSEAAAPAPFARSGAVLALPPGADPFRFALDNGVIDAVVVIDAGDPRRDRYGALGWRSLEGRSAAGASIFPRVSVVVVSYDNARMVESCLRSVHRNTPWPHLEIIVIDNASDRRTIDVLVELESAISGLQLVRNRENVGFARACNQGLALASGEYVVFLNDDTVVAPGWLPRLVRHLEAHDRLGLVGPTTNQIANEAAVPVSYTTLEEMEQYAIERGFSCAGQLEPTESLALFCAVARRDLLVDIGGLDERFVVGMFEDDDLCARIRERGLTLGIARDSFVHHVGHASFAKMTDADYLAIWQANRRRFEQKWKRRWMPPDVPERRA